MTIKNLYPTSRPSLDLNFANTKRLDPRITFSRASSGTYFDGDGLLKSAATNTARFDHNPATGESLGLLVEEQRTNSLTYSQFIVSNWTNTNLNSRILSYSALAPDGTFTANAWLENSGSALHESTISTSTGRQSYTIFAKEIPGSAKRYIALSLQYGGDVQGRIFDLSGNGAVSSQILGSRTAHLEGTTGSIQKLVNGWYRCTVTWTGADTNLNGIRLQLVNNFTGNSFNSNGAVTYTGDGSSGLYVWGLQLEAGSFPTSHIPTPATFTSRASTATYYDSAGVIQTAGSNIARSAAFFPDSSGVMRSAGLLLEAAGTNLLQQSAAISTTPWTLVNSASVTANTTVAPDGTTTGDTLGGTTVSSYTEQPIPWTASGNWTLSLFMKAGTATRSKVYIERGGSQVHGTSIDWSGGVPSASSTFGCSVSFQALTSGWYRVALQLASVVHTTTNNLRITSDSVSGTGTVIIWGVQAEENVYATSYIPTVASTVTRSADVSSSATVTRSADVASITGTNFSSWYNQSQGTLLSVNTYNGTSLYGNPFLWSLDDSSILNNRYAVYTPTGTSRILYTSSGGVTVQTNTFTTSNRNAALVYSNQFQQLFADGNASTSTSGTNPIGINRFSFTPNQFASAASPGSIHHKRLTYYPVRLSDANLQALTAS